MSRELLTAALSAVLCLASAAGAQTGVVHYGDRAGFAAASAGLTVIDFEELAPRSGFANYKAPKSLTTGGLEFRLSGGGRFGPGHISLVGAWYYAGPVYETTTGAKLIWALGQNQKYVGNEARLSDMYHTSRQVKRMKFRTACCNDQWKLWCDLLLSFENALLDIGWKFVQSRHMKA